MQVRTGKDEPTGRRAVAVTSPRRDRRSSCNAGKESDEDGEDCVRLCVILVMGCGASTTSVRAARVHINGQI